MYDSVLMNVAHTQAEPLNGDAARLYEALGVAKYVLLQLCLDAKYISTYTAICMSIARF